MPISRRELIAAGAGSLATSSIPFAARSQPGDTDQIRVGIVVPAATGLSVVAASINDLIGDAAMQGTLLADGVVGEEIARSGQLLVTLKANSPTPDVATRAGRRLVATERVHALVGGVGEGQAAALSAVAEEAQVPFFNIGSPSLGLRAQCARYTFHVEASAAMYLDAMVSWSEAQGHRRWFVVHPNDQAGEELRTRAVVAVSRHGGGGEIVGAASAIQRQPFYGPHFEAALSSGADAIIVLLSDVDQIVFVAQQQNLEIGIPNLLFPHPNTQTRDYIAAMRASAPATNPDHRFALWDAMLEEPRAADFNNRYITRWGDPADPTAWSAYHAVKILHEATQATGNTDGRAIVDYLENSGREFDLLKGPGTSFRSWDHQLRQPLYLVRVDQDAIWDRNLPTTRAGIAEAVETLPAVDDASDRVLALDQFGDGPGDLLCR